MNHYFVGMKAHLKRAKSSRFIALLNQGTHYINLAGRYEYLELPYYLSQDLENDGRTVLPTCKEMLDAYVVPLFLERAKLAGLRVPEYYITNGYFEPPVIVDSVNPFMSRSRRVLKMSQQKSVSKSITRNFTYAACCQELPENSRIDNFRSVLGWCVAPRYREASAQLWAVFHIPLARVRVIRTGSGEILFSKVAPLPYQDLKQRELDYLEKKIAWLE